ncbi:hypothetical protein MCUN1_000779 [Malassezia cuniculi]|uniref:Uncharacterized protein n=1 Tax=Malassezia cuniculi TaxID=948313 RepID=A0AAF0EP18_9BASI|nr:hypothetical protein MCUN1_000779 [Malassezia cuniculi]
MALFIEEISDAGAQGLVSYTVVQPSSVVERHDAGSLLYLLESTPSAEPELVNFDRLIENELLADALGHRLLAVSGYDIDDELGHEQDILIERILALDDDVIAPGSLTGLHRRARTRRGRHARRGIHQEGFIAPRDIDDIDQDDSDEYFDWLGAQILRRRTGHPCWVIDGAHDGGRDSDDSSLAGDDAHVYDALDAVEPTIELELGSDETDIDYVPLQERPRKTARTNRQ